MISLGNFLKLVAATKDNATVGDINSIYFKKYGHAFSEKAKLFQALIKQDLLVEWPWSCFDEYSPYGDRNSNYDK